MTTAIRAHRAYRHEALLYRGDGGFVAAVEPFVREGIDLGQPVMVAVIEPRIALLRAALGPRADWVTFVDMAELGANPAQDHSSVARVRGSACAAGHCRSEVSASRCGPAGGAAEILECQLHEALLNLAVAPDTPALAGVPLRRGRAGLRRDHREAHRSHPAVIERDDYRGSTSYGGAYHAGAMFGQPLPEPCGLIEHRDRHGGQLPRARPAGCTLRPPRRGCPRNAPIG